MFSRIATRGHSRDEGERPFWISFADLMTALMMLFLVVMCVTLLAVTKKVNVEEQRKVQRERDIAELMSKIRQISRQWPAIRVDMSTYRIDLGDIVRFDSGKSNITKAGGEFLRGYVPTLLEVYRSEMGTRWIRRLVVEGFTDQDGTYLYNLGLSLQRSQQVVCALFDSPGTLERRLTDEEKREIRDLFLVGGYSFNSMKASKEASRRVELKIDFWALDEQEQTTAPTRPDSKEFGRC
ncbi:MAG: flagellar motor protein MotB [Betaproteobacteria bacterium]